MDFFDRLEEARKRWNVLEHPFTPAGRRVSSRMRSSATTPGSTAMTSSRSHRRRRRRPTLTASVREHADDEEAHIELWDDFARAAGARPECSADRDARVRRGLDERRWPRGARRPLCGRVGPAGDLEHEAHGPRSSTTGYLPDSPATAYFRLHAELDHEHGATRRGAFHPGAGDAGGMRTRAGGCSTEGEPAAGNGTSPAGRVSEPRRPRRPLRPRGPATSRAPCFGWRRWRLRQARRP